jgi:hypothetical protein
MAILPYIPGINITVLVDDEPAQEYQPYKIPTPFDSTRNQDLPQTKCFIESQAGSPYAIRFKISPLFLFPDDTDVLIISVFVDGKPFDERCIPRSRLYGADYMDKIWYCQRDLPDGPSESYTLAFEDLKLGKSIFPLVGHD